MPLSYLNGWAPFRIDALGLVTLVGAEEVNKKVGRLVGSRYTKFLPLLGAYLIAGDQFTTMTSGFNLCNVSDVITATSLSAWLTRWLQSQRLKRNKTILKWSVDLDREEDRSWRRCWNTSLPVIVGFIPIACCVALAICMGDWWGLSNVVSMGVSVLVRWCLVRENINALDRASVNACYGRNGVGGDNERVKLLATLPGGIMVVMFAPRGLVVEGFIKRLSILNPHLYSFIKGVGWSSLAFMLFLWGSLTFLVKSALSFFSSLARGQQLRDFVVTMTKLDIIFLSRGSRHPLLYQTRGCGPMSSWIVITAKKNT